MTYTTDMPSEAINGKDAQPLFLDNFSVLDDATKENHIALNKRNAGKHNFVQMPVRNQPTIDSPTEGTLYVSTIDTRLTYLRGNTNQRYRMTATDDANFATFGNVTEYDPTRFGGWTFMPGEMIMQYGYVQLPNIGFGGTVLFPKPFSSRVISIEFGYSRNATLVPASFAINNAGPNNLSRFTYYYSNPSDATNLVTFFYWIAIGK